MVYVYATKNELNKYIGKKLTVDEMQTTLKDLGMDIKGEETLENGDIELKVELTAEKLDMISAVGIARAIKYYLGLEKKLPKYEIANGTNRVIVDKSASQSRPKTVAAILRDVPMTQELLDEMIKIQEKIHDSFGRGRKKGAIGIYPIDNFKFPVTYSAEEPKQIVFRPLEATNEMHGLEILEKHDTGKKYAHLLAEHKLFPVFRDANKKVLSMPPIINSHETGRVELNHKDLFIECTGFNIQLLDNILKVLVTTFIEMGAKAESVIVEYEKEIYELNLNSTIDEIELDYINSLIGTDIMENEIESLLNKVMYNVKSIKNGKIELEIPTFRSDVWSDVDIADDVARAYGYNNIIPKFPNISSVGETLPFSRFKEQIAQTLVQMGFLETYTYMLTSTQIQFKNMGIDEEKAKYIRLIDSADQGLNMIRTMVLPNSFETLNINRKNKYPQKIFEQGFTIQLDEKADTGATNQMHLSVSIADPKSNYTQIKAVMDTILKLNGVEFEVKPSQETFLIEGRRADVYVKGQKVGFIGEVHPQILENFGLLVPVASFEVNLNRIFELINN